MKFNLNGYFWLNQILPSMNLLFSSAFEQQIQRVLASVIGNTIDTSKLTIRIDFEILDSVIFQEYIIGWGNGNIEIDKFLLDYSNDNQELTIQYDAIVKTAERMHEPNTTLFKFVLYFGIGRWMFNTLYPDMRVPEDHGCYSARVERFVSMMFAYHCFWNEEKSNYLLPFFFKLNEILDESYLQYICFIRSKIYTELHNLKLEPMPIDEILRLTRAFQNGELFIDKYTVMNFFNDYIDARFKKFPELIAPYTNYLTKAQYKGLEHLSPEHGFFLE